MTSVEIIENIKRILVDPEGVTKERLTQLAYEYASRCRRLDAKLGRAVAYINLGQLSEAYRMESEGKLINEFQTLAFDRAEEWQIVCRSLGCDVAAKVSRENGTELQLFVFEYESVKDLFARSRRLALEGGRSKERLEILYQLQAKFPRCDSFNRSIEELETLRVAEISEQLKNLDKNAPPREFLTAAIAELEAPTRRLPAPAELIRNLRSWSSFAQSSTLIRNARDFLGVWAGAKLNGDDAQALVCLNNFRSGVYDPAVPLLSADEQEALDVLTRYSVNLERRETARAELRKKTIELSRASEVMNDVDKLSNLMATAEIVAENANQTFDPEIAEACSRRIEALQLQQNRRTTAIVVALAVVIVALSVAVLYAFYLKQSEREVKNATAAIAEKLDAFDKKELLSLDGVQKLIDRNEKKYPKFMDNNDYSAVVDRFHKQLDDEKMRQAEFEKLQKETERRLDREEVYFDKRLQKLVRTGEESKIVAKLLDRYYQNEKINNERKSVEHKRILDELTETYEALDESDPFQTEIDCGNLLRQAESARSLLEADKASLEKLDALVDNVTAVSERAAQGKASADLSKNLRDSVGVISTYSDALMSLKDGLDSDSAKVADDAASDVENASRAQTWNTFIDKNGDLLLWVKDASTFEAKSAILEDGMETYSFAPEYKEVKVKIEEWRKFSEDGGFAQMESSLRAAFKPYSKPTWLYYRASNSSYFYLTKKPESKSDKDAERILSSDGETKPFAAGELSDAEFESIDETIQSKTYQELAQKTFDDPKALFEYMLDLVVKIADAPEDRLDPLLKVVLLNEIVKCGKTCPGWTKLDRRFAEECVGAKLDVADIDYFEQDKEERALAKTLIEGLPKSSDMALDASKDFAAATTLNLPKYEWIGFVDVVDDKPRVTLGSDAESRTLTDGASIFVSRGESGAAVVCGEIDAGKPYLSAGKDWRAYRWTPVYLRVER